MRWLRRHALHTRCQTTATSTWGAHWPMGLCAVAVVTVAAGAGLTTVQAQVAPPRSTASSTPKPAGPLPAATSVSEAKPVWAALTGPQQQALAPLKSEWSQLDAARKQKWLELAARMPRLSDAERERIQQRMAEWVRMSPTERGRARIHFQTAQQIAPGDRKDRWEAYQALPADQRQALAAQAAAKRAAPADGVSAPAARAAAAGITSPSRRAPETAAATKRNVVQPHTTPPANTVPRQVAPTVVQARSGATTSLVTTPATPPAHHQVGLPKVNAKAGFVDPNTLLPKRGPQGAAMAAVPAASSAAPTP